MQLLNTHRKKNIIENVNYLMSSRGDSKSSFSQKTGITRVTLSKILAGNVKNIRHSTVRKISNFFGVSCEEIEMFNVAEIEQKNEVISLDGNKNPAAVPIIPEELFIKNLEKSIGALVIKFPLAYFLGSGSNILGLETKTRFSKLFSPKKVLIIHRCTCMVEEGFYLFFNEKNKLIVKNKLAVEEDSAEEEPLKLIGLIMEERDPL